MKFYLYPYYLINDFWLVFRNRCLNHIFHEPPKEWKIGNKGDVVLIPGLHARWISLKKIAKAINKQGYRIHFVEKLGTNSKPTVDAIRDVANYIKTNNLKDIVLIGHSKGGIIAISLLKDPLVDKRIKRVIDIAGPLKGTILSRLSKSSKELQPSSELMMHYSDGIDMKKVVSIYPKIDNMIIPNKNLVGENYVNKRIDVFGHIRIVEAKQTINQIHSILYKIK